MYAIIQTGSKQFKVKVGDIVEVEKLDAEVGASVKIDYVLAVGEEGGKLNIGTGRELLHQQMHFRCGEFRC